MSALPKVKDHASASQQKVMAIVTVVAIKTIIDIKTNRPLSGIEPGIECKEVIAR